MAATLLTVGDPDEERCQAVSNQTGRRLHEFRDCVLAESNCEFRRIKVAKRSFIFQKTPRNIGNAESESKPPTASPSEASTSHLESTSKASYAGKKKIRMI
jgi:hypothetical protein